MKKKSSFKDNKGRILLIWEATSGNLVGEVFENGVIQRGKADMRATFYQQDNDATEYRVCQYFGFNPNSSTRMAY